MGAKDELTTKQILVVLSRLAKSISTILLFPFLEPDFCSAVTQLGESIDYDLCDFD